jgi:TPR repeat protein
MNEKEEIAEEEEIKYIKIDEIEDVLNKVYPIWGENNKEMLQILENNFEKNIIFKAVYYNIIEKNEDKLEDNLIQIKKEIKEYKSKTFYDVISKSIITRLKEGREKKIKKALKNLKKYKENIIALYYIGKIYSFLKNYEKAEKYYLKTIENNVVFLGSYVNLGYLNQKIFKNFEKSKKYFKIAIKYGSRKAMFNMGFIYIFNIGCYYSHEENNYNKAIKYFKKAADLEYTSAMFNLGIKLLNKK